MRQHSLLAVECFCKPDEDHFWVGLTLNKLRASQNRSLGMGRMRLVIQASL
jgi:hypothetical protein